jgi:predicted PurR-regulated permease PerM
VSEPVPAVAEPAIAPQRPSAPGILGIVLFVAALYLGRDIAIPFALALLLAFALAPIADWLRRLRVPKVAAVLLAVTVAFCIIGAASYVFGSQVVQLANNLPSYQQTIQEKLRSLRSSADGGGLVGRVTSTLRDLGKELSAQQPSTEAAPASPAARTPVPVMVEQPSPSPFELIRAVLGQLLFSLMQAGIVIVLLIFMLLEREDLRDRFIKLVGGGDLQKSTEALGEAAERVSRYLLMQLLLNVGYGVAVGIGLYFIGVPNAVLWGLLTTIMKFIPYLGTFLSAFFPVVLAFATDTGWSMAVWTLALFITVEAISSNVFEPWLYGASTGLSSLAIILAAIFWTILWGPVGLVLATPLTVCVLVIGRYVPQLNFLDILLGSDPVLSPEQRFYQRLLSGKVEEAVDVAESYVAEKSSAAFYEDVMIPALRLAENDRQRQTSDVGYRRTVADSAVAVLRELAEDRKEREPGSSAEGEKASGFRKSVLSIGGRTELDRAAAEMVAQALGERGIGASVLPPVSVAQDAIGQLDLTGIDVVCLSYLHPQPYVFAKYISRRLKRREPQTQIVICTWNPEPAGTPGDDPTVRGAADAISTSLENTVRLVDGWLNTYLPEGMTKPAVPENELERLKALRELRVSSGESTQLDTLAARVAEAFDVPIALVSLVEAEDQVWPGAAGLPAELNAARKSPRDVSICGHVVSAGEMIVVEDVARDPRFAGNPFLLEKGIRFYAGAPLRGHSGFVLGSLCVIDSKPRKFSKKEQKLLQVIADELMDKIEAECGRNERRPGKRRIDNAHPASENEEVRLATSVPDAVRSAV